MLTDNCEDKIDNSEEESFDTADLDFEIITDSETDTDEDASFFSKTNLMKRKDQFTKQAILL